MNLCSACGAKNRSFYRYCPSCGAQRPGREGQDGEKSAGMAVFLSTVIPGLGQFYNGEKVLGSILMILSGALLTAVLYFFTHPFLMMGQMVGYDVGLVRLDFFMVILLLAAFFILAFYAMRRSYVTARGVQGPSQKTVERSDTLKEETYPFWAWGLLILVLIILVFANILLIIGIVS